MSTFFLLLIALVWGVGAAWRVYKQARFYQIEEYMSRRYLRWVVAERERALPNRPIVLWMIGAILSVFLGEAQGSIVPHIICLIAAGIAIMPPDEGEIKKRFVRTPRATRLLAASISVAILALIALVAVVWAVSGRFEDFRPALVGLAGLIVLLAAPLWLVLGNTLMIPVEAAYRRRFLQQAKGVMEAVHPKVIGVTGSYGKTTTKHFLRDLLSARYKTYATPKSYNTLMGISRAINEDIADDYSIEYFISEMGAYIPGEIARICDLTPPSISVVVEVGPQHLERFGTLENVAIAKYEIIKALPVDGLGVFNIDNPYIKAMYERGYPANRIGVSRLLPTNTSPDQARFIASDITQTLTGLTFAVTDTQMGQSELMNVPVVGLHNVTNILLATAVAVHEGLSLRDVAQRARLLTPSESRLVRQTTAEGITIINDAYSANPAGVVSALQVLGLHQTGRRLLITPGMVELGPLHESENRKLGEEAAQYATDVILVGPEQTAPIAAGLQAAQFPSDHLMIVEALGDAIAWYKQNLRSGDTVLFLNDLPDTY
jgi:UDP-N-acetylmuramoyl-tripeptide--D-alanyl-D-alanine ligase